MGRGRVYWITGLSGAGKTTVGSILFEHLRQEKDNVVLLDGDVVRKAFGNDLGYTREDRHEMAMRYSRISRMLSEQGIDVVCCTISMFDDVRAWNRENIADYKEVYLRVSREVLAQRNQKDLYTSSQSELVGFGVSMDEPKCSDLVLDNDGRHSPEEVVETIWRELVE